MASLENREVRMRRRHVQRTLSSSYVDNFKEASEKLLRNMSDRPLHRSRSSLTIFSLGWRCSGVINWTILLLILVAIKMCLENLNRYGVRVNPSLWFSAIFGDIDSTKGEFPGLYIVLYSNIPLLVALLIELRLAKESMKWKKALMLHTANLVALLLVPVAYINYKSDQIGLLSSVLMCTLYTCLFLKLVSYIQVNKWCRDAMALNNNNYKWPRKLSLSRDETAVPEPRQSLTTGAKLSASTTASTVNSTTASIATSTTASTAISTTASTAITTCMRQDSESRRRKATDKSSGHVEYIVEYPANLHLTDIYYFWLAPTFCYELNFPRTRRIRTSCLVSLGVEVFILVNISLCLVQQYIIPSTVKTLIPFSNMELTVAAERLLQLALPNHLMWLISFYLVFHSFLNTMAELLRFADRHFFSDWWNASNIETFWKTWNLPVHRWFVRHLYVPLLKQGFSRKAAILIVFLFSAFFHEYLISVPLRMFKSYIGLGMVAQFPLLYITRHVESRIGQRFGNMCVWLSLIIGQPLCIMVYYHDYVVQHYGTHLIQAHGSINSTL